MVKTALWISYDLGVSGDYEGIYAWLDGQGAKECGDSFAFLKAYECQGDIVESLRKDIKAAVKLEKRARIYVVYQSGSKTKGVFLVGGRKKSPWEGYAPGSVAEVDDEG